MCGARNNCRGDTGEKYIGKEKYHEDAGKCYVGLLKLPRRSGRMNTGSSQIIVRQGAKLTQRLGKVHDGKQRCERLGERDKTNSCARDNEEIK